MASHIEQYALLGDTQTAALVADDGSVDWLCAPRFDSHACFAALLGTPEHGRWLLAPAAGGRAVRREYRPGTLVLETEFETPAGRVEVVDCMPIRDRNVDLVRIVRGLEGVVPMRMDLVIRFEDGSVVPWVRRQADALVAVAGPDALALHTEVETRGEHFHTIAHFEMEAIRHVLRQGRADRAAGATQRELLRHPSSSAGGRTACGKAATRGAR